MTSFLNIHTKFFRNIKIS